MGRRPIAFGTFFGAKYAAARYIFRSYNLPATTKIIIIIIIAIKCENAANAHHSGTQGEHLEQDNTSDAPRIQVSDRC